MLLTVATTTALVLAIAALWLLAGALRRLAERDPSLVTPWVRRVLRVRSYDPEVVESITRDRTHRERLAFIVNPTKPGVVALREAVFRACAVRYLPEPLWLYTTAEDHGTRVSLEALAGGAEVLVAVGGDGTVRAVAEAAVAAEVPMGLIPMGTGNLLARNLGLPLTNPQAALRNVLDGTSHRIDVGWLTVIRDQKHQDADDHIFLVIAGVGVDADMVASADEGLKSRFGWSAYFVSAVRHMGGKKRIPVTVSIDGETSVTSQVRTVLIANCGRLPGGFNLVPDASIVDGSLDITTLDARGGVAGWADLFGSVVMQGTPLNAPKLPDGWRVSRIDHARGRRAIVETETPQRVQVDGDYLGRAYAVKARVVPRALEIRAIETR